MKPTFGITREKQNELTLSRYEDLSGSQFHFHSQIEILLVDEGETEVYIGDKQGTVRDGEAAVALSFVPHIFRSRGKTRSRILFIPTYMCEELVEATQNKKATIPFIRDLNLCAKIKKCFDGLEGELNQMEKAGYVSLILGTIFRGLRFEDAEESTDTSLSTSLLMYINENYKNDISLSSIAGVLGYTPGYISGHFRSCFKISIGKYINTVRLKNAVLLMKTRKLSITECAMESGFSSIRTFYRAFTAEFGCSPKEYLDYEK